jgi:hypothetical protein
VSLTALNPTNRRFLLDNSEASAARTTPIQGRFTWKCDTGFGIEGRSMAPGRTYLVLTVRCMMNASVPFSAFFLGANSRIVILMGGSTFLDQPDDKKTEELIIFVERLAHFMNLWTIYDDLLTEQYVPTIGESDHSIHGPRTTIMFILYAYFYSLIEDSSDGLNAFRIWREHFPEEERAIAAIEALVNPFKDDLRHFRNRLGFHGSRSRNHEARGFDLFANSSGTETMEAMKYFQALGAILLRKVMAVRNSNTTGMDDVRARIDSLTERVLAKSGG